MTFDVSCTHRRQKSSKKTGVKKSAKTKSSNKGDSSRSEEEEGQGKDKPAHKKGSRSVRLCRSFFLSFLFSFFCCCLANAQHESMCQ